MIKIKCISMQRSSIVKGLTFALCPFEIYNVFNFRRRQRQRKRNLKNFTCVSMAAAAQPIQFTIEMSQIILTLCRDEGA